jgi:hypothetical protein
MSMLAFSSVFEENPEALICSGHREMARQRYKCPQNIFSVGNTLFIAV